MIQKSTPILLATLIAAALGLSQASLANEAAEPADATPPAPMAPLEPVAPPEPPLESMATPESVDAIIARMEERHRQMAAERERRYEELRSRASELGFEMPEMPPWEPGERAGMPSPDFAPWITPEERDALRERRWQETRARAAEHGIELPELPPWKAAEERRKLMQERFEKFRQTMDALTEEQREAIEGLIGTVPDSIELPDAGDMDAGELQGYRGRGMGQGGHPHGYGMGRGWHGQHRCPHPGQNCNHRHPGYGPMGGPGMMAPPAADPVADPAADPAAQPEPTEAN